MTPMTKYVQDITASEGEKGVNSICVTDCFILGLGRRKCDQIVGTLGEHSCTSPSYVNGRLFRPMPSRCHTGALTSIGSNLGFGI